VPFVVVQWGKEYDSYICTYSICQVGRDIAWEGEGNKEGKKVKRKKESNEMRRI
jgi:hypothetical protein